MSYRFLKIEGEIVWGTNVLVKEDLIRRRSGLYDAILDIVDMTYYDAEANEWKPIEGDS